MNNSIPTATIIAISTLFICGISVGLQPLTYDYPEGTQLREFIPASILLVILLIGFIKCIAHSIIAARRRSFASFIVAILYLSAGLSGMLSFGHSYRTMGYIMAD